MFIFKEIFMKKLISLVIGISFLVGCAIHPDNVEKGNIDYSTVGKSCTELSKEYNDLRKTEVYLYKELKANYNTDIALVITSIITLPVFFPKGTEDELVMIYTETVEKANIIKETLDSRCILVK
jgi:hypothetical protein